MSITGGEKKCSHGCGLLIVYKGQILKKLDLLAGLKPEPREHTYNRCNRLIKNKLKKVGQEGMLQSKLSF